MLHLTEVWIPTFGEAGSSKITKENFEPNSLSGKCWEALAGERNRPDYWEDCAMNGEWNYSGDSELNGGRCFSGCQTAPALKRI